MLTLDRAWEQDLGMVRGDFCCIPSRSGFGQWLAGLPLLGCSDPKEIQIASDAATFDSRWTERPFLIVATSS